MTRRMRLRLAAMRKPIQFAAKAPKKSEKLLKALANIDQGKDSTTSFPMAIRALQHLERYVGMIYKGMVAMKKAIDGAEGKEKALLRTQADNTYLAMAKHLKKVSSELSSVYETYGHLLDTGQAHHFGAMWKLGGAKEKKMTESVRAMLLSAMRKVNSLHAQAGRVAARRAKA